MQARIRYASSRFGRTPYVKYQGVRIYASANSDSLTFTAWLNCVKKGFILDAFLSTIYKTYAMLSEQAEFLFSRLTSRSKI